MSEESRKNTYDVLQALANRCFSVSNRKKEMELFLRLVEYCSCAEHNEIERLEVLRNDILKLV